LGGNLQAVSAVRVVIAGIFTFLAAPILVKNAPKGTSLSIPAPKTVVQKKPRLFV